MVAKDAERKSWKTTPLKPRVLLKNRHGDSLKKSTFSYSVHDEEGEVVLVADDDDDDEVRTSASRTV